MAASNEWFEWHLTPRGWEPGSNKTDFGSEEKGAPPDRVLTIRRSEYLSSSFSKLDRDETVVWRSSDSKQLDSLVAAFGASPG